MDISIATARVALDLLKALAILSDITVRRSAVNQEELKLLEIKEATFLKVIKNYSKINQKYYLQVSQRIQ